MPRHTQPREVAELKGALKHDPQRYRNEIPKAAYALGEPPASMSEAARAIWFELETFALVGVLNCADRYILELTANLVADYRTGPDTFPTARVSALISCLGRLGMTPADRQKLGAEKVKTDNPFNEF